jgi:hypothetical protein
MREITQSRAVTCRMATGSADAEHRSHKEVNPMQTLRASAIALPFIGLAVLIGLLSVFMGLAS